MSRMAVNIARACMRNPAKVVGVVTATGAFLEENETRRRGIYGAESSWNEEAFRYPDTPEKLAQKHELVSGFLSPSLRGAGLVVVPSTAHDDHQFAATQCLERDGFGLRVKTLVTYSSVLWDEHMAKLLGEDENYVYPSGEYDDPKKLLPLKQSPRDYRSGLARICLAHEATHANEYHNIGLMALESTLAALKAAASTRLLMAMYGLGGGPVSFVVAAGLSIMAMADYTTTYDENDEEFKFDTDFSDNALLKLRSGGGDDGYSERKMSTFNMYVAACVTKYLENRADNGAVKLVTTKCNTADMSSALESGRTYLWAASVDDDEVAKHPFSNHPSNAERAKKIEAAQAQLGVSP